MMDIPEILPGTQNELTTIEWIKNILLIRFEVIFGSKTFQEDITFMSQNAWNFALLQSIRSTDKDTKMKIERDKNYRSALFYHGCTNTHSSLTRCIENMENFSLNKKEEIFNIIILATSVSPQHALICLAFLNGIRFEPKQKLSVINAALDNYSEAAAKVFVPPPWTSRYEHITQYVIIHSDLAERDRLLLLYRLFDLDLDGTLNWLKSNKTHVMSFSNHHQIELLQKLASIWRGYAWEFLDIFSIKHVTEEERIDFLCSIFERDVWSSNSTIGAYAFKYLDHYNFWFPGVNSTPPDGTKSKNKEVINAELSTFRNWLKIWVEDVLVKWKNDPRSCRWIIPDSSERKNLSELAYHTCFPEDELEPRTIVFILAQAIIETVKWWAFFSNPENVQLSEKWFWIVTRKFFFGHILKMNDVNLLIWNSTIDGDTISQLYHTLSCLYNRFWKDFIRRIQPKDFLYDDENIKKTLLLYRLIDHVSMNANITSVAVIHGIVAELAWLRLDAITTIESAQMLLEKHNKWWIRSYPIIISDEKTNITDLCKKLNRFSWLVKMMK